MCAAAAERIAQLNKKERSAERSAHKSGGEVSHTDRATVSSSGAAGHCWAAARRGRAAGVKSEILFAGFGSQQNRLKPVVPFLDPR